MMTTDAIFQDAPGPRPGSGPLSAPIAPRPPLPGPGSFDAVVFDHDGTLVDSMAIAISASNAVLEGLGRAPALAATILAGTVHPTALRLGLLAGIEDRQGQLGLAREYSKLALRHAPSAVLYPGIAWLLAELEGKGLYQAVVSNSEGAFIRTILGRLGVAARFRAMLGEDDMPTPKPDPAGLLAALAVGGVQPGRSVYVGDSATDLATARAAGTWAIGVTWGAHARAALEPLGFDALVDTPEALAARI